MAKCVNENCTNDPFDNPNWIVWGCDFDACCNKECYDAAKKQMDYLCGTVMNDDKLFAAYLGVPEKWVKSENIQKEIL